MSKRPVWRLAQVVSVLTYVPNLARVISRDDRTIVAHDHITNYLERVEQRVK